MLVKNTFFFFSTSGSTGVSLFSYNLNCFQEYSDLFMVLQVEDLYNKVQILADLNTEARTTSRL